MTRPTYDVRVNWNADADFTDVGDNVTARALARTPISIQYGRDQARALAPTQPGTASFELDNRTGDYSPDNAGSPLVANLLPARPVRIQATHNAITYTLYRGFLDDYKIGPEIEERSVSCTCLDVLSRLRDSRISTELYQGLSTGEAIEVVLDEIGWPSADRDIDTGATQIPWWWEENTDAWDAIERLLNSEGVPALVTADGDGKFVFRDRHHRLLLTASKTSQATFRDVGAAEPLMSGGFVYDHGWRDIVNSVTLSVPIRGSTGHPTYVWESDEVFNLGASEARIIRVETTDPFFDAAVPSGTDYTLTSGTVTPTLSRTSGQSTAITLTAGGGGAVINGLRLRAKSLTVQRTLQVHGEDATSITRYGRRTFPGDAPWVNEYDALAVINLLLLHRAERLPTVSMRVSGANDTRRVQQLARDLSDRVTIIESNTGLSDAFYIEQIRHTLDGVAHETVFGCEKVPADLPTNPFILGTSTLNGAHTLVD